MLSHHEETVLQLIDVPNVKIAVLFVFHSYSNISVCLVRTNCEFRPFANENMLKRHLALEFFRDQICFSYQARCKAQLFVQSSPRLLTGLDLRFLLADTF